MMLIRLLLVALFIGLASQAIAQEGQPALEGQPVSEPRQEQGAPAGEEDATPEEANALDLLPAIQGIEAAIRDLIAEEDKIESERQEQREVADLQAQKDMAIWAERMFWATLGTVLLTAVGVLLIWRTLLYTRGAAESAAAAVVEARNATAAARDAVTETRRIGEAQVRAYLQFAVVNLNYVRAANGDGIRLSGALINRGQSPALEIEMGGWLGTSKPPLGNAVTPEITMSPLNSYLAPSVEQNNAGVTMPFKVFVPDHDTGEALWFLIVIRYRDVFKKEQYAFVRGQFVGSDYKPLSVNSVVFAAEGGRINVSMA